MPNPDFLYDLNPIGSYSLSGSAPVGAGEQANAATSGRPSPEPAHRPESSFAQNLHSGTTAGPDPSQGQSQEPNRDPMGKALKVTRDSGGSHPTSARCRQPQHARTPLLLDMRSGETGGIP